MSIPTTKQRNAFPGDRTVVFQSPATDVDGGEWPAGTELIPAAGGYAAGYYKGFKPEKMRFVADRFQIRSRDGRVLLDSDEAPRTPIESDPSGLPLSAPGAKADAGKVLGGLLLFPATTAEQ